jgi:hypothetical protein
MKFVAVLLAETAGNRKLTGLSTVRDRVLVPYCSIQSLWCSLLAAPQDQAALKGLRMRQGQAGAIMMHAAALRPGPPLAHCQRGTCH